MPPRLSDAIVLGSFPLDPKAIALTGDGEEKKPQSWVQCAKEGSGFKHALFGEFDITPKMLEEMETNGNASRTRIPLDYNHLSFGATTPDQSIAAGWFSRFERRQNNSELWGFAEWTPKAAKHIQDEEFKYISPLFFPKAADEFGKQIGARLASAALTIYPFLKGMAAVTLSELRHMGVVELLDATTLSFNERSARVYAAVRDRFELSTDWVYPCDCYDDYVVVDKGGKKYSLNYKINEDGSVKLGDELVEIVYIPQPVASLSERGNTTMSAQNTNNPSPDLVALNEKLTALMGVVTDLQKSSNESQAEAKALREELTNERADKAVMDLVRAGKLTPAQKDTWVNLFKKDHATFVSLTATLPVVVKLNQPSGNDSTTPDDENVGEDGIPDDQIEKTINDRVNKYIAANGGPDKVRFGDALKIVGNEDPKLWLRYRASFVKAGSGNMNVVQ